MQLLKLGRRVSRENDLERSSVLHLIDSAGPSNCARREYREHTPASSPCAQISHCGFSLTDPSWKTETRRAQGGRAYKSESKMKKDPEQPRRAN